MGQLPGSNLGLSAIAKELVINFNTGVTSSMRDVGEYGATYVSEGSQFTMGAYRGFQLPTAMVSMAQNAGGIWDGCNFWDTFCYMEGGGDIGGTIFPNQADPDFGYIGAYWTQNGDTYTTSTERCSTCGTELTFGGGLVKQTVHGNFIITIYNIMVPQYTSFCDGVYLNITLNGEVVACADNSGRSEIPLLTHNYTILKYALKANVVPGEEVGYDFECNVGYGRCS